MFARFRKTKPKPKEQVFIPDVIPKHIMPDRDYIIGLGHNEAKQYFEKFLAGLTRTELMDFQDSNQFVDTDVEEAAWEAANAEEWKREYPIGKHEYEERIPSIVRDTIGSFNIKKLEAKVDGMQKKLDRVHKLLETAEFTIKGKEALKL
ncbi:MAG: hypothetical protein ACTSPB_26145 [Candidatus Thorarchaeota archaeon]